MSTGTCLCESVTWEFTGEPTSTYHCHCSMCRKAHGAAFGTYYFVPAENFRWTGSQDTVRDYASTPALTRSFCGSCGSVVPGSDDEGKFVYVPAGCHDEGVSADSHIFVASKAPWLDIVDNLPRHDHYPPDEDLQVFPDKTMPPRKEGIVRGSCLCGEVEFEVTEPFTKIYNCHCQRCRRARAAAFTTNGFTSDKGVTITKGENHMARYKMPDAQFFTHVFCDTCGSGLPRIDSERHITVVPLGALDDDPGQKPGANIYTASKAGWYPVSGDLPNFEQGLQ